MNQNTRPMYDTNTEKNRNRLIQEPVKYILDNNYFQAYSSAHPEDIDVNSDLRMKPTNLNYYNNPQTELYGTAPFKGLSSSSFIDIESDLRNGSKNTTVFNKSFTEVNFPTQEFINNPLTVDSDLRASSTRVDIRNEYAKISNRAFDVNTHSSK